MVLQQLERDNNPGTEFDRWKLGRALKNSDQMRGQGKGRIEGAKEFALWVFAPQGVRWDPSQKTLTGR